MDPSNNSGPNPKTFLVGGICTELSSPNGYVPELTDPRGNERVEEGGYEEGRGRGQVPGDVSRKHDGSF